MWSRILPRGGRQTVGVNLVPKGGHQSPQYSSPPKGQRTKEPLRRTTPSSTIANSTTTASTKQKLEKTTIACYFGVLHHFMLCPVNYNDPPIYRDGGRRRFFPKPLVVIFFRAPGGRGIYKKRLEPTQRPTIPYMGWATPPTVNHEIFWVIWVHYSRMNLHFLHYSSYLNVNNAYKTYKIY
jgi:hypothetical protein